MSSSVITGKWLTPMITGRTTVWGLRKAMARSMQNPPTSWQRPTVLTRVSRQTVRVSVVMGLVMLSSQRVGALVFHVAPDAGEHRDVAQRPARSRRVRWCPRPTGGCRDGPGTSMSTAMIVKPPVEMVTTTKSAPSSARRWSVVVDTVDLAPNLSSAMRAMASIFSSGTGSMSSRTRWTPASEGRLQEIAMSLGDHW